MIKQQVVLVLSAIALFQTAFAYIEIPLKQGKSMRADSAINLISSQNSTVAMTPSEE